MKVVGGDGSLRSQCSLPETRRDVEKEANAAGESDQQSADYLRKWLPRPAAARHPRHADSHVQELVDDELGI